jgi:WD40 repeat protein
VGKLEGHRFGVVMVRFLRDGRLVSCAEDGEVWVWDVAAGRRAGELAPSVGECCRAAAAVAADGCHAALARPEYLGLLDTLSGTEVRRFPVGPGWNGWPHVAVTADARWVVTAERGRFRLWDSTGGADVSPRARHTTSWIQAVRFTQDGRVATATDEDVILWDAATGELVRHILGCGHLAGDMLALSPDGHRAACARRLWSPSGDPEGDNLVTWDWRTGEIRAWEETDITAITWSADGESVVVGTRQGRLHLLDLRTGRRERTWEGITGAVQEVAVSADGRLVAAHGRGRRVHVWELSSGGWHNRLAIPVARRKDDPYRPWARLLFSPDGRGLALVTSHGEVCLGLVSGQKLPVVFPTPPANDVFPSGLAAGFLPSGRLQVARSYRDGGEEGSGTDTVRVFDVTAGREVWASPPLPHGVAALALSPDGRSLACGTLDGTTLLWGLDCRRSSPG